MPLELIADNPLVAVVVAGEIGFRVVLGAAATYVGVSVAFGRNMVRWADDRVDPAVRS